MPGTTVPSDPVGSFRPRHLAMFMVIACGYSWALWLLMIASSRGWVPFRFPANPIGSFGPMIAAMIVAWRTGRPRPLRDLLRAIVVCRAPWRWLVVAVGLPPALMLAAIGAHAIAAGGIAAPQALDKAVWLPGLFLLILVLGGPLGEEPGWRGTALPLLLQRHGAVAASLIIAALWFVWHLPLFWLEGAAQKGGSIAMFAVLVAAMSLLFTWISVRTAPSLVPVLLLHTSFNTCSVALEAALPELGASRVYDVALAALAGGLGLYLLRRRVPA